MEKAQPFPPTQPGGSDRDRVVASGAASHSGRIAQLTDIARFRPDDPDELVTASLACPICLCTDEVQWEGALEDYDPSVQCRCPTCQERWRVYLAPQQALRLGLMHAPAA
jgi:hypothetical protein